MPSEMGEPPEGASPGKTDRFRIATTSSALFGINLSAQILSLGTLILISRVFGQSRDWEAYVVALSIPALVGNLFLTGALRSTLLPIFCEYRYRRGDAEAWRYASSFVNGAILSLLAVGAIGVLLAPRMVDLIAPGFPAAHKTLCVNITRLLFGMLILRSLIVCLSTLLNAYESFALPASAALIEAGLVLAGVAIGGKRLGAYVFVASSAVSLIISLGLLVRALLKKPGARYSVTLGFPLESLRETAVLAIVISTVAAANQINLITDRFFASLLGPGRIAILEYASRIVVAVPGLVFLSLGLPLYADFSKRAALEDKAEFGKNFLFGIKMVTFFIFPVSAFLYFARGPIFSLLYEGEAIPAETAHEIASVFAFLIVALIVWSFAQVVISGYYATRRLGTLAFVICTSVGLNIVLDVILYRPMGLRGLALATSLATVPGSLYLGILLYLNLDRPPAKETLLLGGKCAAAALIAGAAAGWLVRFIKVPAAATGFSLVFIPLCYVAALATMKTKELRWVAKWARGRFAGRRREVPL